MIDQKSHIKMLNLLPSNKAAAEVLRRMKESNPSDSLALTNLLMAKWDQENRPYGDNLHLDIGDLIRRMTPELAQSITEELNQDPDYLESLTAEELAAQMMDLPTCPFVPRILQ